MLSIIFLFIIYIVLPAFAIGCIFSLVNGLRYRKYGEEKYWVNMINGVKLIAYSGCILLLFYGFVMLLKYA